jgi:starvation-inducible DNA-binding protein
MSTKNNVAARRKTPLATPSDLSTKSIKEISGSLNALLANVFGLYLKTRACFKNRFGLRSGTYA